MALVEPLFEDTPVQLPSARPRPGLTEVAQRVRPVVLAGERRLAVPGPLGEILPAGGLQRGSVVRVEGTPGSGATSLLLSLLAAGTAAGEWAALVDVDGVLGGLAAAEAGVAIERLAVVRAVPAALYGRVVATLLDGVTVVGATIPRGFRLADARRLEARARERSAVLVAAGSWPGEAALRLRVEQSEWSGLGCGEGLLGERILRVSVTGRGSAGRERVAELVTGTRAARLRGRGVKPERMLCLWCPDWPVVAARRADPALEGVPVVVLDRGFVLAASVEARAEGVRRGLRRREAEARCPELVTRPVDPAGEARAFEALSQAVEVLAPRLALDRAGLLFVPTRGPSRYFGGDEPFATRLLAEVAAALSASAQPGGGPGTDARVGIADGAFAAGLAARRAPRGRAFVVPAGESAAFLAPWPVRTLEDDDLASLLVRLGLPTLGDFAGLPPASVLGRFGPAGLGAHRRARGRDEHPPALRVPVPELELHHAFDPPVSRVDTAVFAGRALADRLLETLAADGLICTRVRVEAETEHGERLARTWRLSAGAGTRGGHAGSSPGSAILAERVRGQLEAWVGQDEGPGRADTGRSADDDLVTSGLTLLRLVPEEVVVAGRSQLGLWGGDRAAAERAGRALVRLQSLLGPEAVTTPVLQGGRTPDERIAWVPWGEDLPALSDQCRPPAPPPGGADAWPGAVPPPAPAIVFQPARPADLLDAGGQPVTVSGRGEMSAAPEQLTSPALPRGGGPVEAWAGPWLQDLRWWDPPARRRRALWQIVAAGVACLVSVEGGAARLEALYD